MESKSDLDLADFVNSWLAESNDPEFASQFDFIDDGIINFRDFTVFALQWQNPYMQAGSYKIEWDGTNDAKKMASVEGDYCIEVTLEDVSGNKVTRNGNIVVYR